MIDDLAVLKWQGDMTSANYHHHHHKHRWWWWRRQTDKYSLSTKVLCRAVPFHSRTGQKQVSWELGSKWLMDRTLERGTMWAASKLFVYYNKYKSRMAEYSLWLLGRVTRTKPRLVRRGKRHFGPIAAPYHCRPSISQSVIRLGHGPVIFRPTRKTKHANQTHTTVWTKQLVAWNEQT